MQSLLELGSEAKRKAIAAALLSAVVQVLMFGTFIDQLGRANIV
jgi:hypothetical protein